MKTRHVVAVLAVAGAPAAAGAQVSATYSIAFGSPSGPNTTTLAVGQTVDVFVKITHSGSASTPIIGFQGGGFSISGASIAGGAGMWSIDYNTASPTYSLPYPWGAQCICQGPSLGKPSGNSLNGVVWWAGFLFTTVHPAPQNPANVWRGTFTAGSEGTVNFTFTALEPTNVFTVNPTNPAGIPGAVAALSLPGIGGSVTIIGCYPDCDGGGTLTIADFTCFQAKFAAGDPYADCDGNTQFTVADFTCFQGEFLAGCP